MKCPECRFDNREGAKFCKECGAKLEHACPTCGASIPPDSKFCDECGSTLYQTSEIAPKNSLFDEKLTKIQKYLPKGLTEKILSQREEIEGERKHVTVMFCDMVGFTQLSEKLGPEEAYAVMNQVYDILIKKVHDYEGTVNEFTGDGVMALFGAPIALEDAPQRTIRSAYAIHREMKKFSDRIKQEKPNILPITMRIGIHTGPVVVGTLGNDLRVEFKAVGDTVNLASRMQGLAEPGTIYVTEDTFKLTEGLFRFEAIGERQVKGKAAPVWVYQVIAPSSRRTRFDVVAERGLTPFVGRKRELELLLDGFERSKTGKGQAFSIMSEAGAGKSRLLYEFRKAVANEDVTFMEGKCLSYSQGIAYHPIIDIVKSNFDINESDKDLEIRKKLQEGIRLLDADESLTLPYLLELLSVKDSGVDHASVSLEARKDRIIGALNRITIKASQIRPVIMAVEDLHWIDKSSEDSLKALFGSISGERVFMILTFRPNYVNSWGTKSYHSQINLNRLSNQESLALVTYLLGTEEIDRQLEKLTLEKTEGIPFYIEEFIKSLKDLTIIERKKTAYHLAKDLQEVAIPSTIQDVIMARVDSLPDGAKELLQLGSVIERSFSHELIKKVSELSEKELYSRLSVLKDAEVIFERGIYPESTYIFKHALTREVVYDSLLIKKKKKLHKIIGNVLEGLYKENLEEYYSVLAEHFIEGENYEKGSEYSKLAAKKAIKEASPNAAISWAEKWVLCIEKMPYSDATKRKIIDARTVLAGYYLNLSEHAKAKDAVEPIADLAFELNYQKRLPSIFTTLALYNLYQKENLPAGFNQLNEALKMSEKTGNFMAMWFAGYNMGIGRFLNCEFNNALVYLDKCLELSTLANNSIGIVFTKGAMSSFVYVHQGRLDLAYQTSEECVTIAENMDDIFAKGLAYASHGTSCYFKGLFDKAEISLLKAIDFCEKTNNGVWIPWSSFILGLSYSGIGKNREAKDYYKRAIAVLEHTGLSQSWIYMLKILIAKEEILCIRKSIELDRVFEHHKKINLNFIYGWSAQVIADLLLNIDDLHFSEADDWIKKAIEIHQQDSMTWHLAKDCAVYAEILKRKGDKYSAKVNIGKAMEIFQECGAGGWVEKYEKELSALS